MKSSGKKLVQKFGFALEGVKSALGEQVFRIFCMIAIAVFILMILFKVSLLEKIVLVLTVTMMMTLELINSRIERVLDILQPDHDPRVKLIKDISAAAVLIAALGAAVIGAIIFWPYFRALFF
jgi:diacylglycerol kinase